MSAPQIEVHFSPDMLRNVGESNTSDWVKALRDWHHKGDPDCVFGRNVSNSRGVELTWAWHLHVVPDEDSPEELRKWDLARKSYDRTSDRLIIYSMEKNNPMKYGMLLLAFLDPKGHDRLTKGPNAAVQREAWEIIAYTHQISGNMPCGTKTIK